MVSTLGGAVDKATVDSHHKLLTGPQLFFHILYIELLHAVKLMVIDIDIILILTSKND